MKYSILIWGSSTIILWFLYYIVFLCWFLAIQYIYSCLLACTYCKILALCATWFVNSLFSYVEPSPVPSNNNNEAQGPCFSLGLDTVQKRTFTERKVNQRWGGHEFWWCIQQKLSCFLLCLVGSIFGSAVLVNGDHGGQLINKTIISELWLLCLC